MLCKTHSHLPLFSTLSLSFYVCCYHIFTFFLASSINYFFVNTSQVESLLASCSIVSFCACQFLWQWVLLYHTYPHKLACGLSFIALLALDYSVIYDYLSKLPPNSQINEKNISNRLEYLTNNNTLKNKPNNGQDSYFIVNETDQNIPDISPEQIPCLVNFKTPSVKLKTPSKNRSHRHSSHNKDYVQDPV